MSRDDGERKMIKGPRLVSYHLGELNYLSESVSYLMNSLL